MSFVQELRTLFAVDLPKAVLDVDSDLAYLFAVAVS